MTGSTPRPTGLRWSWWNLLLLLPMFMLVTPWYNQDQPRVLGMPLFYWSQFIWVAVGVLSVFLVYRMTRDRSDTAVTVVPESDVDTLDEATVTAPADTTASADTTTTDTTTDGETAR